MRQEVATTNPFNYQNPVNPAEFAGRERQLKLILESVELCLHGRQSNVWIRGDWGIGKTSLLYKIQPKLEEFGLVVNADLGDGEGQVVELVRTIVLNMLGKEPPGIDLENLEVQRGLDRYAFTVSLRRLKDAFGDRYKLVVVTVDNFERATEDTANFLKDIFQGLYRQDSRYMLIVSGRDTPMDSPTAHNPLVRFYRQCLLGDFSLEETALAIERPLKFGAELRFTRDAVEHLHRTTLGHPFFLKLLCFHIYGIAGGKGQVDRAWIDENWEHLSEQLADAKFGEEFSNLAPFEQDALLKASLAGEEFEPRDLRGVVKSVDTSIDRLTKKGHLRKLRRGEYAVYHPLFREFLRAQAAARGLRPKKHAHISRGQPVTGRVHLQELMAACAGRRLDILDPHFRGQAVSYLEHADAAAQIRILRDQVSGQKEAAQWRETAEEWLSRLADSVRKRLQIRAWPSSSTEPFPVHYRAILGDRRAWEVSHSLDQVGRKATTITDKTDAREPLDRDFNRYWKQAEEIFPAARPRGPSSQKPPRETA